MVVNVTWLVYGREEALYGLKACDWEEMLGECVAMADLGLAISYPSNSISIRDGNWMIQR